MKRAKVLSVFGAMLFLTIGVYSSLAPTVFSLSAEQKRLLLSGVDYFDVKNDCGVGSGAANINVDQGFSLGEGEVERRVNLIKALMNDFDLTPEQASGPIGNFMVESGGADLPPDVNQGGKKGPPAFDGGYGWAQWSYGRQKSFIDFAIANGYMSSASVNATDAANYAYLKHELINVPDYASTIPELKNQSTPEDAAVSFEATFEKAGKPVLDKRTAAARQAFEDYKANSGSVGSSSGGECGGSGGIVGDVAFPLGPTKAVVKNPGMFANGTADQGGHPYTAFDILADPGTQVRAFASGTVNSLSRDICGGRLIGIYNETEDFIVSYLHNSYDDHLPEGSKVEPGDDVSLVGTAAQGCKTPHLHIDAMKGDQRGGCSRENCPDSVKSLFIDIGPQLFETFEALPGGVV